MCNAESSEAECGLLAISAPGKSERLVLFYDLKTVLKVDSCVTALPESKVDVVKYVGQR